MLNRNDIAKIEEISLYELNAVRTHQIKDKYSDLRSRSKQCTFALQYAGTTHTLMNNSGFSKEEAQQIYDNYHRLYKVSDDWVQARLDEASQRGYLEVAFGLRVRTPILHQTFRNRAQAPYEAKKEARTAGNALGQSYGLLTNRAVNEFMQRVWASAYRLDIRPVALIHDAIYLVIKQDPKVLTWVNANLIDCMKWQELPEIKHETVKLGAELCVYWPTWATELKLPNDADLATVKAKCLEHGKQIRELETKHAA